MALQRWFNLTIVSLIVLGLTQGCTRAGEGPSAPPSGMSPSTTSQDSGAEVKDLDRTRITFTLPNGLEVLIVSSPKFTKASAAMAVPVGSWSDPEEHQGLAHFLEHMLFLGTKEYPDATEYGAVLANNGGYANAYTARTLTNYFFEVNSGALPEVLRRFSRFFVSPTLDPKFIDKEKNAVHSEFDKNIRSDGWRAMQLLGLTEPEGHPARKFNIGSRSTLKNASSEVLREFYEKYYSSDTMKLVVMGSQPIDELRAIVEGDFQDVPDRKLKGLPSEFNLSKPQAGKWLEMKTIGSKDELSLLFPSSSYDVHWKSKPGAILGGLIGSERAGSLASILKRKHLINSLSAGSFELAQGADSAYFNIGFELTDKGRANQEEIIKTVFSVLGQIQKEGVKDYFFSEQQRMALFGFENRGLVDGANEASRISALMLVHPSLEIDERSSLYFASDDALFGKFLKTLTPENVLVFAQSPDAKADKVEPLYGTEYSVRDISPEMKSGWSEAMKSPEAAYAYPKVNEWVPESLSLFKSETSPTPRAIGSVPRGWMWFQQESGPDTKPIAFATVRIWTPEISKSPRSFLLAQIYAKAYLISQTERMAPLGEAGYSAALAVSGAYVQLKAQGYSAKFPEVLEDLLVSPTANLSSVTVSDEDLTKIKGEFRKAFADQKVSSAIDRAVAKKRALMLKPSFEVEDYEGFLDSITAAEVNAFSKTLFRRIYVDGLAYGNLKADFLQDFTGRIISNLNASVLTPDELGALYGRENILKAGQRFVSVSTGLDNNNAMIVQLDTGSRTHETVAKNMILGNLIQDRYYGEMRTNQQLGYIVQGGASTSWAATRLDFYIQSGDYQPEELSKRTSEFLNIFLADLDKILDSEFVANRDGLILELSRKSSVMADRYKRLEELWITRDAEWGYDENVVSALRKVTKEDVKSHALKALAPEAQARLSIYYYGTAGKIPADFGKDIRFGKSSNLEALIRETN